MDFAVNGSPTFSDSFIELMISTWEQQPSSPMLAVDNTNVNLNTGDDNPAEADTLTSSTVDPLVITGPDDPDRVTRILLNNDAIMRLPITVPPKYQGLTSVVDERITLALRYFLELGEKHILAQMWVPFRIGRHQLLRTIDQPFVDDPKFTLHQYIEASSKYMYHMDDDEEPLDICCRVFRHKLPEWTPDVLYYSPREYPRRSYALTYNVRGTMVLPVFEPNGQSCVGVFELILTSQKINYAPEVDKMRKALEAVNLRSSNVVDSSYFQLIHNESRQQALADILELLSKVCESNRLPLAQTWVPCRHRSALASGGGFEESCGSFGGSGMGQVCMSTTDVTAFYVVDPHMRGFREACVEHHLQKGQGAAGRAFETRSSSFCENITHFSKKKYPLVHYARMFALVASFAICLRSSYTGDDDYILEFFLPTYMIDHKDHQRIVDSLLTSVRQCSSSLKLASGEEIGEDGISFKNIISSANGDVPNSDDATEEGRRPVVERCIQPSEAKYKTAPIPLPREDIEKQFGRTMKEAAKNLNVGLSTLKRKCKDHGISEWQGPNFTKRKSNVSHSKQTSR